MPCFHVHMFVFLHLCSMKDVQYIHCSCYSDLVILSKVNGSYTKTSPATKIKLLRFDIRDEQCVNLLRNSFGSVDCLAQLGLGVLEDSCDEQPKSSSALAKTTAVTKMSSSSHKGRSPLANVSNQAQSTVNFPHTGLLQNGNNEANLRKYISILNDERFFLYRKRNTKQFTGEDHFSKLSDEMILQIFRWLPKKALIRCSQVSKRFLQVSLDETLWTRLDLCCRTLQEGALGRVISRGTLILRLAQAHVSYPVFSPGTVGNRFLTKLQFLDLSMCSIDHKTLHELLSHCRSLRKLSLENVPLDYNCCQEIACNENIEALNLTMCEGLDTVTVSTLVEKLTRLHSLNISWTQLSRESVEVFVRNVTPNLLRLNVAGCRNTLSDSALEKLVKRCPDLLELDLSDCTQLTSDSIKLVCKLQKLEYLSLSRCYNINVTSYLQLTELNSLLFLDVFGLLTPQAITMLQTSFPSVGINKFMHSSVARPTVGTRRTSIWGIRTRD
ncbi:S-phase kinase-associated protein 2 [Toxorhynchites rutilus septentrionalis]|uniref:S-phase kinase-associated protein 2 n=1 Tax=Toxorhynchites rutilus septentrionalis TaxID=329112 RepID=UPI002479AE43|nr:S-phase kinase-associated protein 2 [Toxorhynchites rutilus septentrionalis]